MAPVTATRRLIGAILLLALASPIAAADERLLAQRVHAVTAWCGDRGVIVEIGQSTGVDVVWQSLSSPRRVTLSSRAHGDGGWRGVLIDSSSCSPDGRWIAFMDRDQKRPNGLPGRQAANLSALMLADTRAGRLNRLGYTGSPVVAWAPDSRKLLFHVDELGMGGHGDCDDCPQTIAEARGTVRGTREVQVIDARRVLHDAHPALAKRLDQDWLLVDTAWVSGTSALMMTQCAGCTRSEAILVSGVTGHRPRVTQIVFDGAPHDDLDMPTLSGAARDRVLDQAHCHRDESKTIGVTCRDRFGLPHGAGNDRRTVQPHALPLSAYCGSVGNQTSGLCGLQPVQPVKLIQKNDIALVLAPLMAFPPVGPDGHIGDLYLVAIPR